MRGPRGRLQCGVCGVHTRPRAAPLGCCGGSRQPALPKACALSRPCCRSQHPSYTKLDVFLWSLPSWGPLGGLHWGHSPCLVPLHHLEENLRKARPASPGQR